MVPATSEIFALRFLKQCFDSSLVDWAEMMVLSGFESDYLFILLGEISPYNSFEINELLDRLQRDWNVPSIKLKSEAFEILATAHVRRYLAEEQDSAATLSAIANAYSHDENSASIYDFYLLHHASADLLEMEFQYYWPDADRKNIEHVIQQRCTAWLTEHPMSIWLPFEWHTNQLNTCA